MSGSDLPSRERTVIQLGSVQLILSREDLSAIRAALVAYLEGAKRLAELAVWARGPAWIDEEGIGRIGPWVVGACGAEVCVRFRRSNAPRALDGYRAALSRDTGAWSVRNVTQEHASRR